MDLQRLKQTLLGTPWGHSLLRGRQLRELWEMMRTNPERGGTICQDACAMLLLSRLCQPSAAFVDVGAHIGSVVAQVRQRHPHLKIIAIEADPDKAARLGQQFSHVEVHQCAVGETDGEVPFYLHTRQPGYSSLLLRNGSPADVREIRVPMRRLDTLLPPSLSVEVIKIDVEGAELGVLRGAPDLIARERPVVLFESGHQGKGRLADRVSDLFTWFATRNYEILVPNRVPHDGPPLSCEGFLESHIYPFRTLNYFAIPAERRVEIRERARSTLGIAVKR